MEPSIDDLWFYDLPSPSSPSQPSPQPPVIPRPNPNRPSDLEDDNSPRMQDLHRAFDAMDADHDGELSGSELCVWMKRLGLRFAEDGITRLVDLSDVRRCGSLDFKEFVSLSRAIDAEEERAESTCTEDERKAAHRAVLTEVFQLFDKDHDGLISPKELSDTLRSLGLCKQGNNAQCVDMIRRMDLDGDGQVSFAEFQNMMEQEEEDMDVH